MRFIKFSNSPRMKLKVNLFSLHINLSFLRCFAMSLILLHFVFLSRFFFVFSVSSAYHNTLKAYAGKDPMIAPQFKTWFYVYRNVSSDEKFRKLLEQSYLVEVKDIDRLNDFGPSVEEDTTNKSDESTFEELNLDEESSIETTDSVLKAIQDYDQLNQEEKNQVSKFDKHVDDEQFVDSPVIKKDVPRSDPAEGPEKLTLNTRKYLEDSAEIMIAQENFKFESRVS